MSSDLFKLSAVALAVYALATGLFPWSGLLVIALFGAAELGRRLAKKAGV